MHERKRLTFWQHHALIAMIAIPLLAVARSIGRLANIGDAPEILLHSAVVVAISYPVLTAGAYAAMRYLPKRIPLQYRAIFGCVAVAPILSILSPVMSWFIGIGPPPIVEAVTREELAAAIGVRYPFILIGFMGLGSLMWMSLNFYWWREALQEGEESERRQGTAEKSDEGGGTESNLGPLFLAKLPFSKRGDLWGLSSELHYVRVHTSLGHDLVLMRLADAIEQSDAIEGLQVHRSHWVALDGVKSIRSKAGKMVIVLKSEFEVPVSRSYQGAVRNALGQLIE